jgi:hypothetical protein
VGNRPTAPAAAAAASTHILRDCDVDRVGIVTYSSNERAMRRSGSIKSFFDKDDRAFTAGKAGPLWKRFTFETPSRHCTRGCRQMANWQG